MLPQKMSEWCKSVEDRFETIKAKISRLEGEMIVVMAMLAIILVKVLS